LSEMSHRLAYDIPDPAWQSEDPQKIGQEIARLVERGFEQIIRLALANNPNENNPNKI